MVDSSIIQCRGVYKKLDKKLVLNNINLNINNGEIFGLIGVSGAGKTTLLRCLIGFYKLDKGSILYKNENIAANAKKIRKIFAFATQDNCFYEKLTVQENLYYFGKLYGLKKEQIKITAKNLLALVELSESESTLAKDLSGGMKRRLDMACALMHGPKILILDEPTAGLDPTLRKHMWGLIQRINQGGVTIVVSSHLLSEMEHLCNRIGIINDGELLKIGPPGQLKMQYCKDTEIKLETQPGNYAKIMKELKKVSLPINYITEKEHKLIIYTPQAEVVMHQLLLALRSLREHLIDVDVDKATLIEVFEALTEKQSVRGADEEKVLSYVKGAITKGFTKDQIRFLLLKQGWPEDTINAAMIKLT